MSPVESTAFLTAKPNSVIREEDSQTGEGVYRFRVNVATPLRFSVIVGEILHNLRSSLDQVICHLISVKSGDSAITINSGFPACKAASEFESTLERKVKGARTEVMDVLRGIEPYPGGNGDGIWRLHQANVAEKHRLLVTVGCIFRHYALDPLAGIRADREWGISNPMKWVVTGAPQIAMEDGAEIIRLNKFLGSEENNKYEFTFEIAFSQPEVLKGQAVLPTLTQFVGLTENILNLFGPFL